VKNNEWQVFTKLLIQSENGFTYLINKYGLNAKNDETGETLLHFACSLCADKLVEYLLNQGADPNAIDGKGDTPLMRVLRAPRQQRFANNLIGIVKPETIQKIMGLLINKKAEVNYINQLSSISLLEVCIALKDKSSLEFLLRQGADINLSFEYGIKDKDYYLNPLVRACNSADKDFISFLLANGAKPNARCLHALLKDLNDNNFKEYLELIQLILEAAKKTDQHIANPHIVFVAIHIYTAKLQDKAHKKIFLEIIKNFITDETILTEPIQFYSGNSENSTKFNLAQVIFHDKADQSILKLILEKIKLKKLKISHDILYALLDSKQYKVLAELLPLLTHINEPDANGLTLLQYALIKKADLAYLKLLIGFGAELNSKIPKQFLTINRSEIFCDPIAYILDQYPDPNFIQELLNKGLINLQQKHPYNLNYLHITLTAAMLNPGHIKNYLQVLKSLAKAGVDINARLETSNFTALYLAAEVGYVDVVEYFLSQGGDPTIITNNGTTAISIAYEKGHWSVVDLLLEKYYKKRMPEKEFLDLKVLTKSSTLPKLIIPPEIYSKLQEPAVVDKEAVEVKQQTTVADLERTASTTSATTTTATEPSATQAYNGMAYLKQKGFSQQQIKEMQQENLQKRRESRQAKNPGFFAPSLTSTSKNAHWFEQSISLEEHQVEKVEKAVNCYIYLPTESLIEQGCQDLENFTKIPSRVAAASNQTGLKKLDLPKQQYEISIDNKNYTVTVTDELKHKHGPSRILCFRQLSEEGTHTLIVPFLYLPEGLHKTSHLKSLNSASSRKAMVISLPEARDLDAQQSSDTQKSLG